MTTPENKEINELLTINSKNFSSFNSMLIEIKNTQDEEKASREALDERMEKHIERVEPVIKQFEENEITNRINDAKFAKFKKYFIGGASIIGAYYVFKNFIIMFIK